MIKIGNRVFDTENHTYIMGILNVTPDSFSDGGRHNTLDQALIHCEQMIKDGADIIDIGGESTGPGSVPVSEEEELDRVLPIIEAIKSRFDIGISLDTMKSRVAREGIKAGADLINDVWGLGYDDKMAEVIASSQAACCLMHNRHSDVYQDFENDLVGEMRQIVRKAIDAGIAKDRIILDPGIGFAKSREQDLAAIRMLGRYRKLGFPVLLGVSRKRVIGWLLGHPVEERDFATSIISAFAATKGCAFVRVHDVKRNAEAVKVMEALQYGRGDNDYEKNC